MSNRREILAKLWKKFDFKLNFLSDRIRFQKIIYILSKLDYPGLGEYQRDYGFYIHGPYSSLLAKDAYESADRPVIVKKLFSEVEKDKLKLFEKIFTTVKKVGNNSEDYLNCELISDIIYFYTSGLVSTDKELFKKLVEKKSYFSDKPKFEAALSVLRKTKVV